MATLRPSGDLPDAKRPRLLAIVGLELAARPRRVLEHCGFIILNLATAQTALLRLRRDIKPEAVLVDLRAATAPDEAAALVELIGFSTAAPWDGRPLPVVALTSGQALPSLSTACRQAGVPLVPTYRRNFTELGRLLLDLCGDRAPCCRMRG